MKRTCSLFGVCYLMSSFAHAQTGFLHKTISHQGVARRYVVYVPASYDPNQPTPTILFLHGLGETGTDGWRQVAIGLGSAILLNAEKWNFLVIFPQRPPDNVSVPGAWLAQEELLLAILERTAREYNVDSTRLYLTGLSMGGFGTWGLAARHPRKFAAIAPICGGGDPATASALRELPIWCFHGEQDTVVPVARSQQMIDAVKAAGGTPKFTIFPGVGHNSWDRAYREEKLWEWFLQFRRK